MCRVWAGQTQLSHPGSTGHLPRLCGFLGITTPMNLLTLDPRCSPSFLIPSVCFREVPGKCAEARNESGRAAPVALHPDIGIPSHMSESTRRIAPSLFDPDMDVALSEGQANTPTATVTVTITITALDGLKRHRHPGAGD
ncbi:hypothetical protein CLAIMM_07648 [Cladophialophora immunda]|nr:hypothetical protein CLAIMM_07648 [Cladophialophora immunda]